MLLVELITRFNNDVLVAALSKLSCVKEFVSKLFLLLFFYGMTGCTTPSHSMNLLDGGDHCYQGTLYEMLREQLPLF